LIEEDQMTVPHDVARTAGPSASAADGEPGHDMPRMRAGAVWALIILTLGTSMSMVVPMAYSLTLRLSQLAPGREELLGYVIGAGALANLVTMPLFGVLSDRTRSRFGRRRPWAVGGVLIGLLGLAAMATVSSVVLLGAAWIVTLVAFQTAWNQASYVQGDQLPEAQRGRVSALTGFANMGAPIIGIGLVSGVSSNNLALFLLPGLIGLIGVLVFVFAVPEDSRELVTQRVGIGEVLGKYVFNPRRYPDYAWNWLGRALLFFGLSFTTTYGTFFMASRLGLRVEELGGLLALAGLGGLATSAVGALGAGFLSDRLRRRKIFVLVAGLIGLGATVLSAFSYSLPGVIGGSLLTTLAIGVFSTVDQAILLDVLPSRSESGRFLSISNLAQQVPTALGPLAAPLLLTVGGAAGAPNYTLLFLVSGALFLLGSLVIVLRVRSVR
jgi:MFS family permease